MLLFCDSFDHYTDSQGVRKWSASRNSFGANFLTEGNGRFGNGFASGERWTYVNLGGNYQTLIAGVAVRAASAETFPLFSLWDVGTCHVDVLLDSSTGTVSVRRGASGTSLGSGVISGFSLNTWYYYELRATIDDAAGAFELRVNGVTVVGPTTGADTRNGANAYANRFRIASSADGFTSSTWIWDDVYVCNDVDSGVAGAPNDDFLGDVRIEVIMPNGNGTSSQLDGSDGNSTDNYLLVDETTSNDDTDYVQTTVLNEKDTYNYASLATATGFVYAVVAYPAVRKTDAGSRSICAIARSNGTEDDGDDFSISTSYNYYPEIYEADPDTGDAWDIAAVNAAEFGMKVTV